MPIFKTHELKAQNFLQIKNVNLFSNKSKPLHKKIIQIF